MATKTLTLSRSLSESLTASLSETLSATFSTTATASTSVSVTASTSASASASVTESATPVSPTPTVTVTPPPTSTLSLSASMSVTSSLSVSTSQTPVPPPTPTHTPTVTPTGSRTLLTPTQTLLPVRAAPGDDDGVEAWVVVIIVIGVLLLILLGLIFLTHRKKAAAAGTMHDSESPKNWAPEGEAHHQQPLDTINGVPVTNKSAAPETGVPQTRRSPDDRQSPLAYSVRAADSNPLHDLGTAPPPPPRQVSPVDIFAFTNPPPPPSSSQVVHGHVVNTHAPPGPVVRGGALPALPGADVGPKTPPMSMSPPPVTMAPPPVMMTNHAGRGYSTARPTFRNAGTTGINAAPGGTWC
eukprot:Rhum_TRINITY_DN15271_c7_g1::Rhum_TRINITY_DN15271_c7_g1_i1::g.148928::m.148928